MIPRATLLILLAFCPLARAETRLPAIFSDGMVLQQNGDAPLWGWAPPGAQVTIAADWLPTPLTTTAGPDGAWRAALTVPAADLQPHTIEIRGDATRTIRDVLFGEVWLCSGQSNMEMAVVDGPTAYGGVLNAESEAAAASFPHIRLFTVKNVIAPTPLDDCAGAWLECSPQSVRTFSAAGYFFGRRLFQELKVPIGLISADWGGTRAEAWTSEQMLASLRGYEPELNALRALRTDPDAAGQAFSREYAGWWSALEQKDEGSKDPAWSAPASPDSDWKTIQLPARVEADGLDDFDGVLWFRREVAIPAEWRGKPLVLTLGPIDDMDSTWFNGVRVGQTEQYGQFASPREYRVPADLVNSDRATIAIRVLDIMGPGGFTGTPAMMALRLAEQSETPSIPLAGDWRYHASVALADLPPMPRPAALHANSPTALFNGMIAPLIPFAIRGVIWYQGESNLNRAYGYRELFPAMIRDWRQRWNRGDFPFYYVQIAPYGYANDIGQAAELREAQLLALTTPQTGMVVTTDIGDERDIHPKDKRTVGERLATWALAKTYGRDGVAFSGPLFQAAKPMGDRMQVSFEHAEGLACDGELTGFELAGVDRAFHPAHATISGDTVVVFCPQVVEPVAVRYGWSAVPPGPPLKNAAGLPASPFRSDDWPRVTQGR